MGGATEVTNQPNQSQAWILVLLLAWLALASAPAFAEPPIAIAAELTGDGAQTRFTADLSYPVSYSVYIMTDPYRVIIDLPEINFQLPARSGSGRARNAWDHSSAPIRQGRTGENRRAREIIRRT